MISYSFYTTNQDYPNTKKEAIKRFDKNSLSDVIEHEDYIDFNQYSSNDLL